MIAPSLSQPERRLLDSLASGPKALASIYDLYPQIRVASARQVLTISPSLLGAVERLLRDGLIECDYRCEPPPPAAVDRLWLTAAGRAHGERVGASRQEEADTE